MTINSRTFCLYCISTFICWVKYLANRLVIVVGVTLIWWEAVAYWYTWYSLPWLAVFHKLSKSSSFSNLCWTWIVNGESNLLSCYIATFLYFNQWINLRQFNDSMACLPVIVQIRSSTTLTKGTNIYYTVLPCTRLICREESPEPNAMALTQIQECACTQLL